MPMISRFHGACSFFAWFTSHDSHDSHGRFENVFVTVRRTRAAPSLRRPYGRPGRPVTGVAWLFRSSMHRWPLIRVCAVSPFVSSLWAPAPRTGCWQLDTSLGTGANLTAKSPGFRSSGPGFAMLFDSLWFSLLFQSMLMCQYLSFSFGNHDAPSRAKRIFWSSTPSGCIASWFIMMHCIVQSRSIIGRAQLICSQNNIKLVLVVVVLSADSTGDRAKSCR